MALCIHVMYLHNIIPWLKVLDPGEFYLGPDLTLEKPDPTFNKTGSGPEIWKYQRKKS